MAGSYADTIWERQQSRNALEREKLDNKIIDESGPIPPSAGAEAVQAARSGEISSGSPASSVAQNLAAGQAPQSGLGGLGQLAMAGGAIPSPASPYLLAAGLGLQVLGAGETAKRQQQQAQREAYNERIAKRQEMMGQIARMGIQ